MVAVEVASQTDSLAEELQIMSG